MNADIPFQRVWVRLPYISKKEGLEEGYAFAVQSIAGRALGFHVMLKSGAHYRNVPIHAICTEPDAPPIGLSTCQLWDCFSSRPIITVFSYLQEHEAICRTRTGNVSASYLFTVDWLPDSPERPGFTLRPEQNKCAHVMETWDGNLLALPTNRIAWTDGYFIGARPDPGSVGYSVQEDTYHSESCSFDVSQDEAYFYDGISEDE
jgi:hypothetical protein